MGGMTMNIDRNKCSYVAIVFAVSAAFVFGTAGISQAKKKKEMAKAPEHQAMCIGGTPVCAVKGGMKFTYASSCFAGNDGATVVSDKACTEKPAKKAMKK